MMDLLRKNASHKNNRKKRKTKRRQFAGEKPSKTGHLKTMKQCMSNFSINDSLDTKTQSFLKESMLEMKRIFNEKSKLSSITHKLIAPEDKSAIVAKVHLVPQSKEVTMFASKLELQVLGTLTDNGYVLNVKLFLDEKGSLKYQSKPFFKTQISRYIRFALTIMNYLRLKKTDPTCSNKSCTLWLFFADAKKRMPSKGSVIDQTHANTGFTVPCQPDVEIVIYRREEWLKVLFHESMHAFGLDFSLLKGESEWNKVMYEMFPTKTDLKLYEAYTEAAALIMHTCFVVCVNTINADNFVKTFQQMIVKELRFKMHQMVNVLKHMDLKYEDFTKDVNKCLLRFTEKTNVLAYHVIANVLVQHYDKFVVWCIDNNTKNQFLFNMQKNASHILAFCQFIKSIYNTNEFLEKTKCYENVKQERSKSLRMSVLEL